jgi:hypothetical protein
MQIVAICSYFAGTPYTIVPFLKQSTTTSDTSRGSQQKSAFFAAVNNRSPLPWYIISWHVDPLLGNDSEKATI